MSIWTELSSWRPGDVARNLTAWRLNRQVNGNLQYLYDNLTTGSGGTPEAWTAVSTFINSWGDQGIAHQPPAGFYKHAERVYLRGVIVGGVNGTQAFTLPSGYIPPYTHQFLCRTDINNGSATVTVQYDGAVSCIDIANVGWVDLSPVNFRVT